jgi:predicted small lipoprotein YifL
MVPPTLGTRFVSRLSTRSLLRTAAIGALVVALGLAGCGRKGGLDPPPGGTYLAPTPAAEPNQEAAVAPDGKSPAPKTQRERIFLDLLID